MGALKKMCFIHERQTWSFILREKKQITVGESHPILLMQTAGNCKLYNAVSKRLCDGFPLISCYRPYVLQTMAFTFKTLLIFLEFTFELLINTARQLQTASTAEFQGGKH